MAEVKSVARRVKHTAPMREWAVLYDNDYIRTYDRLPEYIAEMIKDISPKVDESKAYTTHIYEIRPGD